MIGGASFALHTAYNSATREWLYPTTCKRSRLECRQAATSLPSCCASRVQRPHLRRGMETITASCIWPVAAGARTWTPRRQGSCPICGYAEVSVAQVALDGFRAARFGIASLPVTFDNSQVPALCYIFATKASWGPGGAPTLKLTEVPTRFLRMLVRVLLRCRLRVLACDRSRFRSIWNGWIPVPGRSKLGL